MENLASFTTDGVVGGLKTALESLGLSSISMPTPSPIGLEGDGCISRGEKGGVIAMLKKQFPWYFFVWCVAHRLEHRSPPTYCVTLVALFV